MYDIRFSLVKVFLVTCMLIPSVIFAQTKTSEACPDVSTEINSGLIDNLELSSKADLANTRLEFWKRSCALKTYNLIKARKIERIVNKSASLKERGDLLSALTLLENSFKIYPDSTVLVDELSVLNGLIKGAADNVARSKLHYSIGNTELAIKDLEAALSVHPKYVLASKQLDTMKETGVDFRNSIAKARTYSALGEHKKAREVLDDHLTSKDPGINGKYTIPNDLLYLWGEPVDFFRYVYQFNNYPLVKYLLVFFIVLLILFFVRKKRKSIIPRLQIGDFSNGSFEENHYGPYFRSSFRSHFEHLKKGEFGGSIDTVTSHMRLIQLPEPLIPSLSKGPLNWLSLIGPIAELINWLSPIRHISISGELTETGNRGVGVSINVTENKRIVKAYTLWYCDFEDAQQPSDHDTEEKIYLLSEYLSIWLVFEIYHLIEGVPLSLMGTSDWRSYATFRAGVTAENDERMDAAKRLYRKSLHRDPLMRGARLNHANRLQKEKVDDEVIKQLNHSHAIDHYEMVREHSAPSFPKEQSDNDLENFKIDPTYYSATFNLAILKANIAKSKEQRVDVIDLFKRLVKDIEQAKIFISNDDRGFNGESLTRYLSNVMSSSKIVLGSVMISNGSEDGLEYIKENKISTSTSGHHHYNIACAYSMVAGIYIEKAKLDNAEDPKSEDTDNSIDRLTEIAQAYLDDAFKHLKRAFEFSPFLTSHAEDDDSLISFKTHRKADYDKCIGN